MTAAVPDDEKSYNLSNEAGMSARSLKQVHGIYKRPGVYVRQLLRHNTRWGIIYNSAEKRFPENEKPSPKVNRPEPRH